jgi:hypothetical protein
MAAIFISYRQADSKAWAIALSDELVRAFGEDSVFLDRDALHAGSWREQIRRELARSKVVLVVIGPRWLEITDDQSQPRIALADDVHRQEVALALTRKRLTVIPVLVDDAAMPSAKALPPDLSALAERQARRLGDTRARRMADLAVLISDIEAVSRLRSKAASAQPQARRGSVPVETNPAARPIELDVSLYTPASEEDDPLQEAVSDYAVSYTGSLHRGSLTIAPRVEYLARLRGQGPIRPASYWHGPFERDFALPSLDIKLVNNSGRTIFLTQAILDLEKSVENDEPLPIIRTDRLGSWSRELRLLNDGWGKLPPLTAAFNLSPLPFEGHPEIEDLGDEVNPPFGFEIPEEPRGEGYENQPSFDLSEALAASGVDLARLVDLEENESIRWTELYRSENPPELIAALGPFKTNTALVKGELRYADQKAPEGQRRIPFVAWTWLVNARRKGKPRPPTCAYHVLLEPSGGRRSIVVPIAQELRHEETDRFILGIASPRSSRHRFRLRLAYGSKESVRSSLIDLDLFMPRSAARFLTGKTRPG